MTIASFCREQLLTHGPLSLDELTERAVAAGVTRAKNPHAAVAEALRYRERQLLDGRWVTPLWLLEGRCLTAASLPYRMRWYGEVDPDLGLLGDAIPTREPNELEGVGDRRTLLCLSVKDRQVTVTRVPHPQQFQVVVDLAARLAALTRKPAYGDLRVPALRAVAQLMVDDPSTFGTPLPPLSSWVPTLVEDELRREEVERQMQELHDQWRRTVQVGLDDCTAIEVQLAAERARVSVEEWTRNAIDRALVAERPRPTGSNGVVIDLRDRWARR